MARKYWRLVPNSSRIVPSEHSEQAALIAWTEHVQAQYPEVTMLYAIPNGGARSGRAGAMLKREGVRPGVPDLCLPIARSGFHALYIEMKTVAGGRLSQEQRRWRDLLISQSMAWVLAEGAEAAITAITNYLQDKFTLADLSTCNKSDTTKKEELSSPKRRVKK